MTSIYAYANRDVCIYDYVILKIKEKNYIGKYYLDQDYYFKLKAGISVVLKSQMFIDIIIIFLVY